MANPVTWPEIGHLPDYYCNLLDAHIRHRNNEESFDPSKLPPLSKEQLYELIFDTPQWNANVKYDGTNLGLDREGQLYGRRQKILAPTYQKCSVKDLPAQYDLAAVAQDLLKERVEQVTRFFVYGELVIHNKYDYSALNLYHTWVAFGICLQVSQPDKAQEIYDELTAAGYRLSAFPKVTEGTSTVKLTIMLTEKLRELLTTHKIPTAQSLFGAGNLYGMITQCGTWMREGRGEGLVCVGPTFQRKWKIGLEVQPGAVDSLKRCVETLAEVEDMDPRVIEAGRLLLEVKESCLLMGEVYQRKQKKGKDNTTFPAVKIFQVNEMEAAIRSALTKYDSLESFFAGGHRKKITTLLVKEVEGDLMPTLASDKDVGAAKKEIVSAVNRNVGTSFGEWKVNTN